MEPSADSVASDPTMKAALIHETGGPEVIRIERVPVPDPGPGEVRVRVEAAALNHLDLWVRRGLPIDIEMPHVGGSDLAGTVDAVGEGVERGGVRLGARVVVDPSLDYVDPTSPPAEWDADPTDLRLIGEHVDGGFAQYAIVPAANLVELPDDVDFDTAAAASLAVVTAWRGLVVRGGVREGDTVLITGASGGVSTLAIQIARTRGARVVALTSTPWVERVRALGADVVLDRLQEGWRSAARDAVGRGGDAGGHGVDVILDSVGQAVWKDLNRLLAPGGRLVSYGATTGAEVTLNLRHHFWKQTSFLGSTMGSPDQYHDAMTEVFEGRVRPVVHARMPLDDLAEAHRRLEAGDVFGKIVIHPWA